MINELRLGPGWRAALLLVSGSLGVGCAEGTTSIAGLFDSGGATIDGDIIGLPGHDAGHDTGTVVIVTGGDTGAPGRDAATNGMCATGETLCSGSCVDTQSSAVNCGACGVVCDAGVCNAGACGSATTGTCLAGETLCGTTCTVTATDPNNCGTCGMACASGETCANSSCGAACTAGQTSCSGVCTDTTSDSSNCGTCGMVCPSGETCSSSSCQSSGGGAGCAHSPCTTGAALSDTCDPYGDGTTDAVCYCFGDIACCTTEWDSQCVAEAETYCDDIFGCEDPQCP